MDKEILNLEQVASLLHRDVREVTKLANRGHLPGQKVAGQWRFASAEINYWIEQNMSDFTEQELTRLETGAGRNVEEKELRVSSLLSEATMAASLQAGTRSSVLKELVRLADQSWLVYDADALLESVKAREDMASTAFGGGVAFPHPRRPLPAILGESLLAYARTPTAIPFGGEGGMCDIFFLVCCRNYATHLQVLARLSRLMLRPGVVDDLRGADTVGESFRILEQAESSLTEVSG